MNIKTVRIGFLWSMIISLAIAAFLGISALLWSGWSELQSRVLITALLFSGFSINALMAATVLERRRLRSAMWISIACAGFGLVGWLVLVWLERPWWRDTETIVKPSATFTLAAVTLALVGLLMLPTLIVRHARVVRGVTIASATLLAGILIFMIWADDLGYRIGEFLVRTLGVFAILTATGSVVTPILWRLQSLRHSTDESGVPQRASVRLTCPRCGCEQAMRAGGASCQACKLRITIEIEEPRCACGYLLHRLVSDRCPECGRDASPADRWLSSSTSDPIKV